MCVSHILLDPSALLLLSRVSLVQLLFRFKRELDVHFM